MSYRNMWYRNLLNRARRRTIRIPHQVAALAAVVLLVTAWTGDDADPSGRAEPTERQGLVTLRQASGGEDPGEETVTDRRARSPASLMLFRFN